MPCSNLDAYWLVVYVMFPACIADIPEGHDMLSMIIDKYTKMPCFRFEANRKNSVLPNVPHEADSKECKWDTFHIRIWKLPRTWVSEESMIPIKPVFYHLLFRIIHSLIDISSICLFKKILSLFLGLSELLKECSVHLLRDKAMQRLQ